MTDRRAVSTFGIALMIVGGSLALSAGDPQQSGATPPPAAAIGSPHQSTLSKYCAGCHNDKVKSAGFSLAGMDVDNIAAHSDGWEKVVRKLQGRAMPPIGRPRPDDATYDLLIAHLETSLDRIAAAYPNPGRTETFRRLTRTEYRNAIRDLLGVEVEVESLLPTDDSSFGFDNVTVGTLSPTLMERYLASAQKISRLAIGNPSRPPGTYTLTLPVDRTQ
jgi:hypothetical protein